MIRLLAELHRDTGLSGPVLTLGNQDVYAGLDDLRQLFTDVGCHWREPELVLGHTSAMFESSGDERTRRCVHARTLFEMLGLDGYADLDAFDFDQPAIKVDLNVDVPVGLRDRFGLVLDGGTVEHIFDVRTCLANVVAMTRVGGRVIHVNSASNMIDHGFWAINPSTYFDFYEANGFADMQATIFEWDTRDSWAPCAAFDYEYGMLINGLCDPERVPMVWFSATKVRSCELTVPIQGLYREGRQVAFSGGIRAPEGTPPLRRRIL